MKQKMYPTFESVLKRIDSQEKELDKMKVRRENIEYELKALYALRNWHEFQNKVQSTSVEIPLSNRCNL